MKLSIKDFTWKAEYQIKRQQTKQIHVVVIPANETGFLVGTGFNVVVKNEDGEILFTCSNHRTEKTANTNKEVFKRVLNRVKATFETVEALNADHVSALNMASREAEKKGVFINLVAVANQINRMASKQYKADNFVSHVIACVADCIQCENEETAKANGYDNMTQFAESYLEVASYEGEFYKSNYIEQLDRVIMLCAKPVFVHVADNSDLVIINVNGAECKDGLSFASFAFMKNESSQIDRFIEEMKAGNYSETIATAINAFKHRLYNYLHHVTEFNVSVFNESPLPEDHDTISRNEYFQAGEIVRQVICKEYNFVKESMYC